MNTRGATALMNMIIATIIFSAVCVVLTTTFVNMASDYNIPFEGNNSETLNALNQSRQLSEDMQRFVEESETSDTNAITQMAKGSFQAFKLGIQSMGTSRSIISETSSTLGVPIEFTTAMLGILTTIVIFGVILIIFRAV